MTHANLATSSQHYRWCLLPHLCPQTSFSANQFFPFYVDHFLDILAELSSNFMELHSNIWELPRPRVIAYSLCFINTILGKVHWYISLVTNRSYSPKHWSMGSHNTVLEEVIDMKEGVWASSVAEDGCTQISLWHNAAVCLVDIMLPKKYTSRTCSCSTNLDDMHHTWRLIVNVNQSDTHWIKCSLYLSTTWLHIPFTD